MTQPLLQPPGEFAPQTVDKVERLLELLAEIGAHRYLGPRLVLHGGPALNVFHLDIPRLSVDIDVLYVGGVSRETMLAERSDVRTELETLARRLGYKPNDPKDEHAGVTYKLMCRTAWGEDVIKVDLNFLNRAPVLGYEVASCRHCAPEVTFNVVPYAELIAGKVKALVERRSPAVRDLYDIYRSSETPFEDWELLRALVVYYWTLADAFPKPLDGAVAARFLGEQRALVVYYWTLADAFPKPLDGAVAARFLGEQRALESALFPVLLPQERPELGQMVDAVSAFLNRLGHLTPGQQEYVELMAGPGIFQPALIFGAWPEILARAEVSPAAAWKVQNLRKRAAQP